MRGALCAVLLLAVGSHATAVTPVQKVIQMLQDMLAKGTAERKDEQTRFAEYKTFCKDTSSDKGYAIQTEKADIEQLNAAISKASSDVMVAAKEIAGHDADITTWTADRTEATRTRKEAHAVFQETHGDYTGAISAVERALSTLKAGNAPAASLLQVSSLFTHVNSKAKKMIMSFLQEPNLLLQDANLLQEDASQPQAKSVNYEGSSGGVIQMVEGLGAKFEDERSEIEKAEANNKHSYDMMNQDLTSQIDNASEEHDAKIAHKAQREQDKAEAEGGLADTTAALAADEKFLADLTGECEQKALDFESRQALRQGELDAINQAIEIMSGDAVSGSADKHLPSLIQRKTTVLVQLRSTGQNMIQQAVANFLEGKAQRMNSRLLSLLANKVSSDPFKKINKMIQDMITKLTNEANEEAEHKGFCDAEMTQNKQTRDTKSEEVSSLTALSEELSANIAKLSQQISDLGAAIESIDKAVSEATAQRAEEGAKNTATIADAKAGQAAVAKALEVLKTFYDTAATATALTQVKARAPGAPATFDEAYTGMEGGGVLGMLEVCESDFVRLDEETTTGEAQAKAQFEQFSADSGADKDAKTKESKDKSTTRQQKESALASATKDLKSTQEELTAALEYYEKLKPSCVDAGESYEDRVKRREEEIESLKEALNILNGDSI